MSKKMLSLALALAMCLGLTVPAFADSAYDYSVIYSFDGEEDSVYNFNYSANGYTDPSAENVTFSVAPIGMAKIRWVFPGGTSEYAAYVFDQDCTVTRKDGLPLQRFSLPPMFGDMGYSVPMGVYEQWAHIEEEWAWVEPGAAGIRADSDNGWAYQFVAESSEDWSPLMMSKKGLDTVFPYELEDEWTNGRITGTVVEYRQLSAQPAVSTVGNFTDVKKTDWFADPVLWAVEKNITAGTSDTTFSPNADCTTAQILSFLWRANGSPKPTTVNPFSDVKSGDYFADAAAWAYEKGIVSGETFGGNTLCTRSMAVTYMWKATGSPNAGRSDFTDVPASADYASAVAWAVEQGVTAGTSNTTFSPDSVCTRGQIVSFLYRGLAE